MVRIAPAVIAKDLLNQIDSVTRLLLSSSYQNVEHFREARQVFETGVAILAVERATPEDIDELKDRLADLRRSKKNRNEFVRADMEFHRTIAKFSKNPLLYAVSSAMLAWLEQTHIDYETDLVGSPELEDLTYREHEKIFNCFAKKDGMAAAKEISDHILRVNRSYSEYVEKK